MGRRFHPCDAAFNLSLPLADISSPTGLVAGVDCADDGHICKNYNKQWHKEVEEENTDNVELDRNRVQRLCPVDFARAIPVSSVTAPAQKWSSSPEQRAQPDSSYDQADITLVDVMSMLRLATFDVADDTDGCQCVDADESEEQD